MELVITVDFALDMTKLEDPSVTISAAAAVLISATVPPINSGRYLGLAFHLNPTEDTPLLYPYWPGME